jgi:hypothetical protein
MTVCRSVLLRMRNVSEKPCREKQNSLFMFNNFSFGSRAVYEVMWQHTAGKAKPQIKIYRMCALYAR